MEPSSILLLILFIGLSAFFSGSESAFLALNMLKIQTIAKTSKKARLVQKLRENTDKLLITLLIGTNVANIAATAMVTSIVTDKFGSSGVGIATGIMTLIILTFGEILPKNMSIPFALPIALYTAPIFYFLQILLSPIIWFFQLLSKVAVKIIGGEIEEKQYSEEDLKTLVEVGVKENEIHADEKKRIEGVLNFDDLTAGDVMTPRIKMKVLQEDLTLKEVYSEIVSLGVSRVPIYNDDKDDITGIVYLRDFLEAYITKPTDTPLRSIAKIPLFIGEYEIISDIFEVFKKNRVHIAIVQDEYGGTSGLVTMEDIIEEITGDIFDETDDQEEIKIKKHADNVLVVSGDTEIEKINEVLDIEIERTADFNTISGYLQSESEEHIQNRGYKETINGLEFEVLEMKDSQPSVIQIQKGETEKESE